MPSSPTTNNPPEKPDNKPDPPDKPPKPDPVAVATPAVIVVDGVPDSGDAHEILFGPVVLTNGPFIGSTHPVQVVLEVGVGPPLTLTVPARVARVYVQQDRYFVTFSLPAHLSLYDPTGGHP